MRLPSDAEAQADAGDHCCQTAHHADGRDNTVLAAADVKIAAAARRVGCRQVASQHIGDRHPHLVARAGVADHWTDDVALRAPAVEGMDRANRRRFFARPEPCLRDHPLPHPALQGYVVQAEAHQPGVERQQSFHAERLDAASPFGIPVDRLAVTLHDLQIRFPVDVFRGIERGIPTHR